MKNRKVLVFTAFADTASYLYDQLKDDIRDRNSHVALVQGSGGNRSTFPFSNDYDDILMCTGKSGHEILLKPEKLIMPRKRYSAEFKKEAGTLMIMNWLILNEMISWLERKNA